MMFPGADWRDKVRTVIRRGELIEDYQRTFDSPHGRRVLHDLVRQGGVMVTHGGDRTASLQFEEGKRFLALYVLGMLRIVPQQPEALQSLAEREVIDD